MDLSFCAIKGNSGVFEAPCLQNDRPYGRSGEGSILKRDYGFTAPIIGIDGVGDEARLKIALVTHCAGGIIRRVNVLRHDKFDAFD